MDLATSWPYVLAAVLLLAVVILVVLVMLLKKSSTVSKFSAPDEPADEAEEQQEEEEEQGLSIGEVFRRATRRLKAAAEGNIHEVPFYMLAGAAGSRAPEMLATAGPDLPFGKPADAELSLGKGRGFWFFDRGVILDVAGDHILRADGKSADDAGWNQIIASLQRMRPKRPIDGLIVTVSATELTDAAGNEISRAELASRASRIYRKVWDAQQRLGFRLPTYIVITGCEELTGFTSFCSALPLASRGEMLGWSSPYSIDSTYKGVWAEEAFNAIAGRVDDLQMEVFAEGTRDAEQILRLPQAVRTMAPSARVFLDHIFKASAYHETLILRGIYLCGREAVEERTAFANDLIEKKVFAEWGVASPTVRTTLARNRKVRNARIATIAAALLLGLGLIRAKYVLDRDSRQLEEFLTATSRHVAHLRAHEHESVNDEDLRAWSIETLHGISKINFRHFGPLFLPRTWFSSFPKRLEASIQEAFSRIVLKALRDEIEENARLLAARPVTAPTQRAAGLIAPVPGGTMPVNLAEPPSVQALEQMPEFVAFQQYITEMRAIEENGRLFNRLCQKGEGDLKDLSTLLDREWKYKLPESFFHHQQLYERALHEAECDPFEPSKMTVQASYRAELLARNLFVQLFSERNPLTMRLQYLSAALHGAAWQWPSAGETERFAELDRRMKELENALPGPELEWAFRREFYLGPTFDRLLGEIERSGFFGPDVAGRIRAAGASGWVDFQNSIAATSTPLTGPILSVRDGKPEMQLSTDAVLLKSALESFLGQAFVAAPANARQIQSDLPPGQKMLWTVEQVEQASSASEAYERFREKTLSRFPANLRASIDQVARDRVRVQMVDLLGGAQRLEAVPPIGGAVALEDEIRTGVANFSAAVPSLSKALDGFGRLRMLEEQLALGDAANAEAFRLLSAIDRLLHAEEPYRPRQGSFVWWDGATPPSPSAWGARDAGEVAGYLEITRGRVATLARSYAYPLLGWFGKSETRERPDVKVVVDRWQGIVNDLRDYEAKKPGNPIAVLEDYILTSMPKVGTADCVAANLPASFRPQRGFYAATVQDLSHELSSRCYFLAGDDAMTKYNELARYFNTRLANRYPFAGDRPKAGEPEADPEDVRGFYKMFDANVAVIKSTPAEGGNGPSFAQAKAFVDEMVKVRRFFAPFLDAPKPESTPSFDVEATFRVLRELEVDGNQIIGWSLTVGKDTVTNRDVKKRKVRWTPGQPVSLALRWASDAPRIPVVPAAARGVKVSDRTIVFDYSNRWALLTALDDHLAPVKELPAYADSDPVTLALSVPTKPADGSTAAGQETKVFLRVTLLAPGTTQTLDVPRFPVRAPRLGGMKVAEERL